MMHHRNESFGGEKDAESTSMSVNVAANGLIPIPKDSVRVKIP